MFQKIKEIIIKDNFIIIAKFENGKLKKYDFSKIISTKEVFKDLKNEQIFKMAKLDPGGYGISWNENLDIASEEIWENGTTIEVFE